jgi:hypothetical protein
MQGKNAGVNQDIHRHNFLLPLKDNLSKLQFLFFILILLNDISIDTMGCLSPYNYRLAGLKSL